MFDEITIVLMDSDSTVVDALQQRVKRGLRGIKTPIGPPVSVANITVKDNVYMPTSELVSV